MCDSSAFKSNTPIQVECFLESDAVSCDGVHNICASLQLTTPRAAYAATKPAINFVVVIDVSSSMRCHHKLSHVQATIEYMLSQLNCQHKFCLIQFNDTARMLTEGLVTLSESNKQSILESLHSMQAEGSTNISEALLLALKTVQGDQSRLSSILLFTDGLANMGMRGAELVKHLKLCQQTQPYFEGTGANAVNSPAEIMDDCDPGPLVDNKVSIHTFGFGLDHDSSLLQGISLSNGAGGVYYYLQSTEHIATTFSQCMSGIVNTVVNDIKVTLSAGDGCRFVRFCTPFKLREVQQNKHYVVDLGSMYLEESRTLLFKLSLRGMKSELLHALANITVSCIDSSSGEYSQQSTSLSIWRPKLCPAVKPSGTGCSNPVVDIQLNRFQTAQCLLDVVAKATQDNFAAACEAIAQTISQIQASPSSCYPYCRDLVKDLTFSLDCVKDSYSFNIAGGKHMLVSLATMYLLERSTGAAQILMEPCGAISAFNKLHDRSCGYGYMTEYQEREASKASAASKQLLTRYLDFSTNVNPVAVAPSTIYSPSETEFGSHTHHSSVDISFLEAGPSKHSHRKVLSQSDDSLILKHKQPHSESNSLGCSAQATRLVLSRSVDVAAS